MDESRYLSLSLSLFLFFFLFFFFDFSEVRSRIESNRIADARKKEEGGCYRIFFFDFEKKKKRY
jgi:hypothetical protein